MKVSDYLPNLYYKNAEMINIIYSEEDELENKLKVELENVFKNTFAKVATKAGIENWEKLLNIELDSNRDNLEYRRNKVLTKLSTTVPLSYKWLEENLTSMVGPNNFYIELHNNQYKIYINIANLFNDTAETIYDLYRPLLPANLEIIVNLFEEETANLYFGVVVQEGEFTSLGNEVT